MENFDYNPLNDVLFKFIFGAEERKNITINFLNAVLNREGEKAIREIEFHNVELVPQCTEEKLSRIDIFAILDNRERVDIEVQCVNYHNMEKRTLFYWAQMFLHNNSLKSAESYKSLRTAIAVNILSYKFLPSAKAHSKYELYDAESEHKLTDAMEIHFLEVPKFERKKIEEMSRVERWLGFLSKKLSKIEMEAVEMAEPAIGEALGAADLFFMDEGQYWEYLNRQAAILDYNSGISAAREEGLQKGEQKGREEGKFEMVKKMLSMKMSIDDIAKISEWSKDKILSLKDTIN